MESRSSKKKKTWSPDQETIFIQIWKEKREDLLKNKRNNHVVIAIQKMLENKNIHVGTDEIKNKMKALRKKYRLEKKEFSSDWKHFENMKEIINKRFPEQICHKSVKGDIDSISTTSLESTSSPPLVSQRLTSPTFSKKKNNYQRDLLIDIMDEIISTNKIIENFVKSSEDIDKQLLETNRRLLALEERKTLAIEKIAEKF